MALKSVALCFLFCFVLFTIAQERVRVDVYYESLCPDSRKFFTTQLYQTLQGNLSKYIDLKLIPYGKSKQSYNQQSGTWEFECHHGPNECFGNKIHVCALDKIEEGRPSYGLGYNKVAVSFINCLMTKAKRDPFELPSQECATMSNVQRFYEIENCAGHTDGSRLLSNMGNETMKFQSPLVSVPTIVFKGVYKKQDSDLANTAFSKVLCGYITNKPAECNAAAIMNNNILLLVSLAFLPMLFKTASQI